MAKIITLFFVLTLAYKDLTTVASSDVQKIKHIQQNIEKLIDIMNSSYKITTELSESIKADQILLQNQAVLEVSSYLHSDVMMLEHANNKYYYSFDEKDGLKKAWLKSYDELMAKVLNESNFCINKIQSLQQNYSRVYEEKLKEGTDLISGTYNVQVFLGHNYCEPHEPSPGCLFQNEYEFRLLSTVFAREVISFITDMSEYVIQIRSESVKCDY